MADPYLSEIRLMSFSFAPRGWALCNGASLQINQNQALYALLGTTYGGNGTTTFALPNLQGRTPIHVGNGHTLGESAGEQSHTLSISELPMHTHVLNAQTARGDSTTPVGSMLAKSPADLYGPATGVVALNSLTSTNVGGSQAHLNMQPFLTLSFCIALQGIFPSQS